MASLHKRQICKSKAADSPAKLNNIAGETSGDLSPKSGNSCGRIPAANNIVSLTANTAATAPSSFPFQQALEPQEGIEGFSQEMPKTFADAAVQCAGPTWQDRDSPPQGERGYAGEYAADVIPNSDAEKGGYEDVPTKEAEAMAEISESSRDQGHGFYIYRPLYARKRGEQAQEVQPDDGNADAWHTDKAVEEEPGEGKALGDWPEAEEPAPWVTYSTGLAYYPQADANGQLFYEEAAEMNEVPADTPVVGRAGYDAVPADPQSPLQAIAQACPAPEQQSCIGRRESMHVPARHTRHNQRKPKRTYRTSTGQSESSWNAAPDGHKRTRRRDSRPPENRARAYEDWVGSHFCLRIGQELSQEGSFPTLPGSHDITRRKDLSWSLHLSEFLNISLV